MLWHVALSTVNLLHVSPDPISCWWSQARTFGARSKEFRFWSLDADIEQVGLPWPSKNLFFNCQLDANWMQIGKVACNLSVLTCGAAVISSKSWQGISYDQYLPKYWPENVFQSFSNRSGLKKAGEAAEVRLQTAGPKVWQWLIFTAFAGKHHV